MKKINYSLLCLLFGGALMASATTADELRIPVGSQASDKTDLAKPRQGTSKADVERQFGEPIEWTDAVGEPPISSWEYPDYIIYFEHDLVLHTVLKTTARPIEE